VPTAASGTLLSVCRMVRIMASATIAAVRAEAAALANVAAGLTDPDLARSSPCPPWTVADLLGHVIIAVSRIGQAIATPDDVPSAMVTAAGYYRPDHRFSAAVNDDRIATARALAARLGNAAAIAAELDRTCRDGCQLLEQENRIVRTRHGDRMLLTEFAKTRVVELGVHGLDVAAGLGREPWLTRPAADVLTELMLPDGTATRLCATLGVDMAGLIARLTGRATLSAAEQELLRAVERLPLG
jgi:uncharacterized protein (TIGR03083 family)